ISGRPAALNHFALASTASVADSVMDAMRAEIRGRVSPAEAGGVDAGLVIRSSWHPGPDSRARVPARSAGGVASQPARFDLWRPYHVHSSPWWSCDLYWGVRRGVP